VGEKQQWRKNFTKEKRFEPTRKNPRSSVTIQLLRLVSLYNITSTW